MNLDIFNHLAGLFQENAYIIWQENSNECLLIDSGSDPETFINATDPYRFQPQSIINTHSNLDHIGAISDLQLIYAIPYTTTAMKKHTE